VSSPTSRPSGQAKSRRPAKSGGRPARQTRPAGPVRPPRAARPDRPDVPLERGRAAGVLAGFVLFTAGFAAAGLCVLAGAGGTPGYLVAITAGLVGVGAVGLFWHRGTVDPPEGKIWSPAALRAVITPLGLPALPLIALLYLLAAVGVIGNLVVPAVRR